MKCCDHCETNGDRAPANARRGMLLLCSYHARDWDENIGPAQVGIFGRYQVEAITAPPMSASHGHEKNR